MKEKYQNRTVQYSAEYEENKIKTFESSESNTYSYRIYEEGLAGIHFQKGCIPDEEGYKKAAEKRIRPYKFQPESTKGSRDLTEQILTGKELLTEADILIKEIQKRFPDFIFSGGMSLVQSETLWTNENGMELFNKDAFIPSFVSFKHKNSKDISDGWFGISQRTYSREKMLNMAEEYLGNYGNMCQLPEEVIFQTDGMFSDLLIRSLNAENLALGISLLSDKIGQQVFSPDVTLMHDVSGENAFNTEFWDGEGCECEDNKKIFIDKGKILFGMSNKKIADKYNVPHTASAFPSYSDLPESAGRILPNFQKSDKTAKELLAGRYSVVPLMYSGGGFNEKGDYAMPIHNSLLCDGEKVIGRLPAFTISGNMFDFFGKDFIGVPCDKPITQRKTQLIRVKAKLIE